MRLTSLSGQGVRFGGWLELTGSSAVAAFNHWALVLMHDAAVDVGADNS